MATLTHLCLGTVYAWSFFQKPISENYHWSNTQTAWAFSLAIFMLGITAAWGGKNLKKIGFRKLAVTGAILYASGYVISYFALKLELLWLLYIGFGFVGGIGLGLAYVTPVAAVSGWFPEKQGLVTGMVVMGFGLGAFVMSKILAPLFLKIFENDLSKVFLSVGIILILFLPVFAYFLEPKTEIKEDVAEKDIRIFNHILKPDYLLIWFMFMLNIVAGMIFISFQSPLLQDLLKLNGISDTAILEKKGATLIAISALFNGIGRFLWGSISDKLGRITTFRVLIFLEIIIFTILIFSKNPLVFSIGVCIVLLCYGGGFGVIPSLIKEKYGSVLMASVYGISLIAWGFGGILGPQITAYMKDNFPQNAGIYSFIIGALLLALGFIFSLFLKKDSKKKSLIN